MYFALGGGISKQGWIVWSRVFIDGDRFCFDTGLAEVITLPP
jgi:hypothetical protein